MQNEPFYLYIQHELRELEVTARYNAYRYLAMPAEALLNTG